MTEQLKQFHARESMQGDQEVSAESEQGTEDLFEAASEAQETVRSEEERVLTQIDAAVGNAGQAVNLSPEQAKLEYHAGGFASRIEGIKKKIHELRERTENKIVDIKVDFAVKKAAEGRRLPLSGTFRSGKLSDSMVRLKNVISSITQEQLMRQTELVDQLKDGVSKALAGEVKDAHEFKGSFRTQTLENAKSLLDTHPEVYEKILYTPENEALQRKALLKALYDTWGCSHAKEYADLLHIKDDVAVDAIREAIKSTMDSPRRGKKNDNKSIYDIESVTSKFDIPPKVREELALLDLEERLNRANKSHIHGSWIADIQKDYGLAFEDVKEIAANHKERLTEISYSGSIQYLTRTGNDGSPPVLEMLKAIGLEATEDGLKQYILERPELAKQIIIDRLDSDHPESVYISGNYKGLATSRFIPEEFVHSVLQSEEGKGLGEQLFQKYAARKASLDHLELMAETFGLDMEDLRKDPAMQEVVRERLMNELSGEGDRISRDFVEYFGFDIEIFRKDPMVQEKVRERLTHELTAGRPLSINIAEDLWFDIETFRKDPVVQEKVRERLISELSEGRSLSTYAAMYLGFDMEKVRPEVVSAISADYLKGDRRLLEFLDTFELTEEEKRQISQEVFGNPSEFQKIGRVYDFAGWNSVLMPDSVLRHVLNKDKLFSDVSTQELADILVTSGVEKFAVAFIRNSAKIPGIERGPYIEKAIESVGAEVVARALDDWSDLPPSVIAKLIPGLIEQDIARAIPLNLSYTPPPVPALAQFARIVGAFGSKALYELYLKTGENEGEFRGKIAHVKKAMEESNPESLTEITQEPVLLETGKAFVRVDSSQFGSMNTERFKQTIETYVKEKDSYAPMPEGYAPGVLETFKQQKNKGAEQHVYSPEFTERWKSLLPSLQEAEELSLNPHGTSRLYKRFLRGVAAEKRQLELDLERAPNDMAKANVEKRLAQYTNLNVRTEAGMADAFTRLYDRKKSPQLAELFRVYGLYGAFKKQADEGIQTPSFLSTPLEEPSPEDISKALEFTGHVAHQETWEKNEAFASKEVRKGLDSLFHTKALEQEVARLQEGRGRGEKTSLTVLPSRDILTEFSGNIGDACWASKYNILKDFPQITSLTFFQDERVAGSCLLIDSETETGVPLTTIRGLNPLEAVINKLDMESFVESLKEYVGDIATKRGRRLSIVIDDHSGGSGTNRPLLYAYLSGLKSSLEQVKGVKRDETTFNGYDITRDMYYLDTKPKAGSASI